MVLLITPAKTLKKMAQNTRERRLQMELTQEGLSKRSGVPLATLRKFEQKGTISLESFLKIQMALGTLEDLLKATEMKEVQFASIDEVLESSTKPVRQRGRRK